MADKTFRDWRVDQVFLLPPSVDDFVPEDHPARIVRELVEEALDLSPVMGAYSEIRGQPSYHPRKMVALLFYAYSQGIYSSREIARCCQDRMDFMAVTACQRPDFRTVNAFRKRHLSSLGGLFDQILALCRGMGLASLGHVSIDGTRIQANASKHKAMSYGRMVKAEAELSEEIREMLSCAEAADAAEDLEHGVDGGSGMLPEHLATKRQRRERIKEHMAALEVQAAAAAEAAGKDPAEAKPEDKAQRNFTDPESRLMKTKDGFGQCYNGQIVVDADNRIIVAHGLTAEGSDQKQLEPMIEAMEASAGELPEELSADAGYCSEENLKLLNRKGIRGYVATGRRRHGKETATGARPPREGTCRAEMDRKLKREGRDGRYRLRKITVEPVFGQIKQARRFRQFLMRGVENARREWTLVCIAHNLNKLVSAWPNARPAGA